MGDTRTPVIVSGIDLLAFIALAVSLRGPLGHVGVSVAVAGSSAVQMVLLLALLKAKVGAVRGRELFASFARTTGAALVAGIGGWSTARLVATCAAADKGTVSRMLPGIASGAAFVAIFALAAWGAGAPEIDVLKAAVRRKVTR
jgi:peptidoglycan biosynthesis protein MviN/MurJ (putative lipid II flippase)